MSDIAYLIVVRIVSGHRIDGRCSLDALVVPQQARMRLLEIGKRGC